MRRILARVYDAALWLAAFTFALIAGLVLVQISARLFDRVARFAGFTPPGLTIPSLAEIGAYLFAGAVFLGLAGTFRAGQHVRVKLVIGVLPATAARWLSVAVSAGAAALAGFATWSSLLQAWDSYQFGSVSYGVIPIPLVIPQGAMTLGLAIFCVALIDAALTEARGGRPAHADAEKRTEDSA